MLFLLLFDVVLSLLHVDQYLFKFFVLHIFLGLRLFALDIASNNVFRRIKLLDLEVDYSAADLNCLCDCWG